MLKFLPILLLFVLSVATATSAQAQSEQPEPTRRVVDKTVGDAQLSLHVFEPEHHSAEDHRPAIAFFFGGGWNGGQAPGTKTSDNIHLRGRLTNSLIKFRREGEGRVAFLGGSITEMDGYRPLVAEFLRQRFADTDFTFINAGIASTCSTTGAFRLKSDVLEHGPIDLLFVEFAVNDDQDAGHARRECIRGMEGIIRQARMANPKIDIVVTYFVNPGMLEQLQQEKTPLSIASHEAVLQHYNIPAVHLAKEVAERISEAGLSWEQYGGTHPKPAGNKLAADMIRRLLGRAWSESLPAEAKLEPHPLPEPLDANSYMRGRFIDPRQAQIRSGWELRVPDWDQLPGSHRARFDDLTLLCATKPGAEVSLAFDGTAVGAYLLAGPDAGMLQVTIDGRPASTVDLYHHYSRGLHYPRTVMFATDLASGEHQLVLKVAGQSNSQGHAARILQFVAN